jgi:CRP-like cAMP-binding protein
MMLVERKGPPLPIQVQESPFARKLGAFVTLTSAEFDVLEALHKRRRNFPAGRDLIYQGQTQRPAYILASGWACSYKILSEGTRQIVDVQIPGDFLGLRSMLFRVSDHNIEPLSPIEASEVQARDLIDAFRSSPRLATAVLWAASRDEAIVVERLIDLGRRAGLQRMAHFLLELGARLMLVGLAGKDGYDCPLSQYVLADALGLSAVHVNRVLRELREDNLVTFRDGKVIFDDFDGLVALAEFDVAYLDQSGPLLR